VCVSFQLSIHHHPLSDERCTQGLGRDGCVPHMSVRRVLKLVKVLHMTLIQVSFASAFFSGGGIHIHFMSVSIISPAMPHPGPQGF